MSMEWMDYEGYEEQEKLEKLYNERADLQRELRDAQENLEHSQKALEQLESNKEDGFERRRCVNFEKRVSGKGIYKRNRRSGTGALPAGWRDLAFGVALKTVH